jgi:hypothetical protein
MTNWDKAPSWANYLVTREDGSKYFNDTYPNPRGELHVESRPQKTRHKGGSVSVRTD